MDLSESSKPALTPGCVWGGTEELPLVLFGNEAMEVRGTGLAILSQCDGTRTFAEIVAELQRQYLFADPHRICEEASAFLQQLHEQGIVSY